MGHKGTRGVIVAELRAIRVIIALIVFGEAFAIVGRNGAVLGGTDRIESAKDVRLAGFGFGKSNRIAQWRTILYHH